MSRLLIKNADSIVTCDTKDRIMQHQSILIEGSKIISIGTIPEDKDAQVIDAKGMFIYPGLVNTHHHVLQAFSRNIPEIQSSELFDWLLYLYNIWEKVNPDYIYYSSMVAMAEFVKYGGTTLFDHHFAFPKGIGKNIIDRQFEAAKSLGLRFHAGRGCFTRGKKEGGLPPNELVETLDEVLDDSLRLVENFHDPEEFSMRQVALAPCSPFSVSSEVMIQSARLARDKKVRLHTHLAETLDEEKYCLEVYGKRPLAWAESCEWVGPDVWYAHGIHFTDEEIDLLSRTKTGVAHCPVSNMKLSSGIAKIPQMLEKKVPVGLALDGCGSNDASNLLADLRIAYLLHRLSSSTKAPTGYEILKLATVGSAAILGRSDIGSIEVGKAADLFMIDINKLEFVGGLSDPASFLGTVGYSRPVDMTIINGKIVFRKGRLTGIDEEAIKSKAAKQVAKVYGTM
ncbi:amidohydrolase family protein [Candidatus Formimonas warabiya]|uniref:8-oxoguanine deaminase n=1 Tax=Formimonas warabiya TaxID=1761012 RepID=A0A3G1KQY3_FORW1|nr:amidohydrolase family protein [Candidatus Formimonas warabiya]ATW24856.1 8-oxoguanine deaminase [Candidatus Formimonas warabiya]